MIPPTARFALLALCLSQTVHAQREIQLWPNGLPAGAKQVSAATIAELRAKETSERITYVDSPSMTVFAADPESANGCGVVIYPGGGYNILAWQKEGVEVAKWFNSIGVTAAVVKYRVPRREPRRHWEPMQDGFRALRIMRHHAADWKVDPERIGVLGFSAGGHLAMMVGSHFEQPNYEATDKIDEQASRPDFICLIYAAYLGDDYNDGTAGIGELVVVNKQTPPTFMSVTIGDKFRGVQAGQLLEKYKRAGVSVEAHVYAQGGHGYGLRNSGLPAATWPDRVHDWMRAEGLLQNAAADAADAADAAE